MILELGLAQQTEGFFVAGAKVDSRLELLHGLFVLSCIERDSTPLPCNVEFDLCLSPSRIRERVRGFDDLGVDPACLRELQDCIVKLLVAHCLPTRLERVLERLVPRFSRRLGERLCSLVVK